MARYADENNYVICQFAQRAAGDVYVSLQQYDNGIATERAKGDVVNYDQLGGADITAAVQVWGNQAACAFNDHMISTVLANNPLVNPPAHGQVGFSVWDPTKGTSEIIVKTAAVTTDIYNLGPNIEE